MIVDVSVDIGRNIIGHWNVFIEILDSCANVMGEFHAGRLFFASEELTQDSLTQSGYKDHEASASLQSHTA